MSKKERKVGSRGCTLTNVRWQGILISVMLICAPLAVGTAIPSGRMIDYHLHCSSGLTSTEAACATLVAELERTSLSSGDEKLALLRARKSLAGWRKQSISHADVCSEVRAIVEQYPDYATARYYLSHCAEGRQGTVKVLKRVLELEPRHYDALAYLLMLTHGADGTRYVDVGIDALRLESYRRAFYVATRTRANWEVSLMPLDSASSQLIWSKLFRAARYIYFAADRIGDWEAMAAIKDDVRSDANLDALDFQAVGSCQDIWTGCRRGSGEDSLRLACHPILSSIGLESICLSAIEQVASEESAKGLELSPIVLEQVDFITNTLRQKACGSHIRVVTECRGWDATETPSVARLRTVLANHGGVWSSEHHRVYAQRFLGDEDRLNRLRTALVVDPENEAARCDLTRALAVRERTEEAVGILGDGNPECLQNLMRGLTWIDWNDVLAWQERWLERSNERIVPAPTEE